MLKSDAAETRPAPRFTAALFLIPIAFLFLVFWYGLKNWFEQDDFAWLGLHNRIYDFSSFLSAMFAPMAQGTIRPWSERGFFLLFYKLFGANALPYHIAVFATQAANLVLLACILLRLTASRLVAVAGPLLWTANSALITPLCWVSDYNQIQCAAFLLLAFLLYLQERYFLQFAVFILGFGALELNIVYPAIVLAYVVLCRFSWRNVRRTLPLFAVSLMYYVLHSWVAPRQTTGVYALHFDGALPHTFWTYCRWVFAGFNSSWRLDIVLLFVAGVIVFVIYEATQQRRLPFFFIFWFVITLAPIVPLRDHVSNYYLSIPSLGIAAVLALALNTPLRIVRFTMACLAALYLFIHLPIDRLGTHWYFGHTRAVRNLVWGVQRAQVLHPGKIIVLSQVSDDLYRDAIAHSVFRALDISGVYLAPELLPAVERLDPDNPDAVSNVLPAGALVHSWDQDIFMVYSASGEYLRSINQSYERSIRQKFGWDESKIVPNRVDIASPLMAYLLGSAWYAPEGDYRWMPVAASLRIGGPKTATAHLLLHGYCPPEQTRFAPLELSVAINGHFVSVLKIAQPETSFSRSILLPSEFLGHASVEVTLAVNRTLVRSTGEPPMGLAFRLIEIR